MKRVLIACTLLALVSGVDDAAAQSVAGRPPPPPPASAPAVTVVTNTGPYIEEMPAGSPRGQGPLVLIRFPTPPGNFAPGDAGAQEACGQFNYGSWKAWGGVEGTNRLAWVICNISSH
jgi:hypothetical protein